MTKSGRTPSGLHLRQHYRRPAVVGRARAGIDGEMVHVVDEASLARHDHHAHLDRHRGIRRLHGLDVRDRVRCISVGIMLDGVRVVFPGTIAFVPHFPILETAIVGFVGVKHPGRCLRRCAAAVIDSSEDLRAQIRGNVLEGRVPPKGRWSNGTCPTPIRPASATPKSPSPAVTSSVDATPQGLRPTSPCSGRTAVRPPDATPARRLTPRWTVTGGVAGHQLHVIHVNVGCPLPEVALESRSRCSSSRCHAPSVESGTVYCTLGALAVNAVHRKGAWPVVIIDVPYTCTCWLRRCSPPLAQKLMLAYGAVLEIRPLKRQSLEAAVRDGEMEYAPEWVGEKFAKFTVAQLQFWRPVHQVVRVNRQVRLGHLRGSSGR